MANTLTGVRSLTGTRSIRNGAPVLFDAAASSSAAAASSLSFSHTCTGSNRLLIVGVSLGQTTSDASEVLAVTYGGVSMTSILLVHANSGTRGYVQMFGLIAPATGVNTVSITLTGGLGVADLGAGAISFTNVNQSTAWQNATSAVGNGTASSLKVTTTVGNMVVDAVCCGSTMTVRNMNNKWIKNTNLSSAGGNGAGSIYYPIASSQLVGYNSLLDDYAIIGVDIVRA